MPTIQEWTATTLATQAVEAAAPKLGGDVHMGAKGLLVATPALRLQDAEEAGIEELLAGLFAHPPRALGRGGALAQARDHRLGTSH